MMQRSDLCQKVLTLGFIAGHQVWRLSQVSSVFGNTGRVFGVKEVLVAWDSNTQPALKASSAQTSTAIHPDHQRFPAKA